MKNISKNQWRFQAVILISTSNFLNFVILGKLQAPVVNRRLQKKLQIFVLLNKFRIL